ncbi:MAG: hypothetical protein HYY11_09570 [Candidatus Methylomirabilis oxyfera]|nr:hypothetical protein [Candidatus Methylomirabilis oxyfera]
MVRYVACLEKAVGTQAGKSLEQFFPVRYGILYMVGSRLYSSCVLDLGKAVNGHIPHAQLCHLLITVLHYSDATQHNGLIDLLQLEPS